MFMSYLSNLPYCLVGAIGSVLVAKNLLKTNSHNSKLKNIIIILLYTLVNCFTFDADYVPLQSMIKCLTLTLVLKQYYGVKISTSLTTSVIIIILTILSELILMFNPFFINNIILIRENVLLFTLTNVIGMLICHLISKINLINKPINRFICNFENNKKRAELIILVFLLSSLLFFIYLLFASRNINLNNLDLIVFMIILCVIFYIFIYDKNKYDSLIDKYNDLLEYAYTYEEKLDKDKLIRHEHKNQLAVIKGMTKNKKVVSYIDEILKNNKEDSHISVKGINNLPKGGLRGLIYYKLCLISKKKINYSLDISKNVKREFDKLIDEDIKILSYVIGVFLDNAIEECEKEDNSNLSIEVYKLEKSINIVISNTIHNQIKLNKIGEKGYTTKGRNHGNGIFLVKNLIKENDKININTKIINNYFVQEIKINTKKKDV